jgi:hypothetical protein
MLCYEELDNLIDIDYGLHEYRLYYFATNYY